MFYLQHLLFIYELLLLLSYYYILFCLNFYYLHTYYTSEFRECMPIFLLLLYGPPSFTSLLADLHFILIRQISPPCSKCLVPTIILIIPQSSIYPYIKKNQIQKSSDTVDLMKNWIWKTLSFLHLSSPSFIYSLNQTAMIIRSSQKNWYHKIFFAIFLRSHRYKKL